MLTHPRADVAERGRCEASRATSSQAPSVAVGESQTLILQLRLQHAVLFAQVLDGLMLVALEPTDESSDEQLQWNHAPSLRHLGRNFWTLRASELSR